MRTFAFRITCRFAVLVTATTAAVLVIAGFLLDREVEHGLELLHEIEVHELTELIGTTGTLSPDEVADRIKHDADSDAALFVLQVAEVKGNVVFRSDNLGATILPAEPPGVRHWTTAIPFLGRVHLSAYSAGPWRIYIGSPLEPAERVLREYARMSGRLLLAVALASVGLGYAFSRATLRPIRAIEATAKRISADNLAERIAVPPGRDELASLTQLLNQTFDRLQQSFEQVNRFSADVSHELKTPLALIRLNVEKLRSRHAADAETMMALGDVLEEIARLHQFIDRLLFLAKAESGSVPVTVQRVDIAAFMAPFAEDAQALAEDRGVECSLGRNEPGQAAFEPHLIRQLLLNLVANAVSVSPRGGSVQVESYPLEAGWRFSVMDEGPGIPEADLARVFERFVQLPRSEAANGVARSGHGLGLAICRSIVVLHRGTIQASNRTDRSGLVVSVTLP